MGQNFSCRRLDLSSGMGYAFYIHKVCVTEIKGKNMTAVTATPKSIRPHVMMAEIEEDSGYRHWTKPMPKFRLDLELDRQFRDAKGRVRKDIGLSDYCCASTCWCAEKFGW